MTNLLRMERFARASLMVIIEEPSWDVSVWY